MKRTMLIRDSQIFHIPGGEIYARASIEGVGRKEFKLGLNIHVLQGLDELKRTRKLLAAKERAIQDILQRSRPKAKSLIRVEDLCEEIIRLQSVKAPATLESALNSYRKHLIPFANEQAPYFSGWVEQGAALWEQFILARTLKRPGCKLFNDWKHLGMLMRHAYRKGLIVRLPELRNPDPPRSAGRRLSEIQVRALLAYAGAPLRVQILMAITMGMRKSEILKLSWERVDLKAQTVTLRPQDTKTRRARIMGMSEPVSEALGLAHALRESDYVFPSRYSPLRPSLSNKTAWQACKRRAKVRCRFHDLRHTFLSVALLERQLNPLHVAVYAGVSLSEIQRTYLHPGVEDTRCVAHNLVGNSGEKSVNGEVAREIRH